MKEKELAAWMQQLAERSAGDSALPDPIVIWWTARLAERRAAELRARRPLWIAQWLSAVVSLATAAVLLIVYWPAVRLLLAPLSPPLWAAAAACVIMSAVALGLLLANWPETAGTVDLNRKAAPGGRRMRF